MITDEMKEELEEAREKNRDKNVDRRIRALLLYAEGRTGKQIGEITGYNRQYLYKLYAKYISQGIQAISESHYRGNRRNMTFEEEATFLEGFADSADKGRITDVKTIKAAYDKRIGHETGHGQIYYVLHRHGWSKKLPRSQPPKSASSEAIEASKKFKLESEN